jgi:hypothetical protein
MAITPCSHIRYQPLYLVHGLVLAVAVGHGGFGAFLETRD